MKTASVQLDTARRDLIQARAAAATARQHEQMLKGDCSMMQGMMQGMMGGMKTPEPTPRPEVKPKADDTDHSAHHPPGEKK